MEIPNTITDAYNLTCEKCSLLAQLGINVETKISQSAKSNEMKSKVLGCADRLQPEAWIYVQFNLDNIIELSLVNNAEDELRRLGINFDTSGCGKLKSWEIDWSFRLLPVNHKDHSNATERKTALRESN